MKTSTLTTVFFSTIALVAFFCLPAQAKQDGDKGNNGKGHDKDAPYGQTKEKNDHRPDMLDPYGHSRDNRKELYGNRGRPIRETVPDPVIPPPPDPVVPPPEPDPVTPPPEPDPEHEPDQVIPPLPPDYVPPQPDPRLMTISTTDTTSRREARTAPVPSVPF